jgi:hypothetical protein
MAVDREALSFALHPGVTVKTTILKDNLLTPTGRFADENKVNFEFNDDRA